MDAGEERLSPLARAGRNLLFKSLGETLARVCFAALFIFTARIIGAGEYGRYSFAASLAALAQIGMDLGLNTLFVRDCARNPALIPKYAGNLLVMKLSLLSLMLTVILGFCLFKGYPLEDTALILAVTLAQSFWGLSDLGVAGFNALERMDLDAMIKVTGRFAALLAAGSLLAAGLGVWGLALGLLIANALAACLSLYKLKALKGFTPSWDPAFFKSLFKESLPLALTNIFILVYFRVDIVMMEAMGATFREIGWYAAGVRVIDAAAMVPAMAAAALLPVLSSLAQKSPRAMRKLYSQGQRLMLILGIPSAVGLWTVRQDITSLVYGPSFGPTGPVFIWLAPVLGLLFLNFLQMAMLTSQGRQRLLAWATGACVLVNVGLNLWLIPAYGFMGAAFATCVTEVVLFTQCSYFIGRGKGAVEILSTALRPALAAGIMGVGLWLAGDWHVLLVIPAGIIIYAAALFALRGLTKKEVIELWGLLRNPAKAAGSEAE
ncbi:flippase [Dethiosulfatarculus sandiegensis]|uniref:Uncharacterized protein n=1 Tax=Dethiosulfatarculus sandiegensis TaxID=1429043 RepID=A0A0D2JNH3_9BACT|nr:flippase [Dethiosulfatarculus sandiegensis]KIX11020.1 hypothetical protein X474_27225 [Dethiosulfatarculus sandiegensis]